MAELHLAPPAGCDHHAPGGVANDRCAVALRGDHGAEQTQRSGPSRDTGKSPEFWPSPLNAAIFGCSVARSGGLQTARHPVNTL
jgi:hypothetical protein